MASERKTIKLQTLTPVHIGSGEILKENFDYTKDNRFVYILDSKKLFKQLEQKGFSEDKLTNALTQGNIKAIVDKYLLNILVTNYCIRKIQITPNQREKFKDGLREQIYDGLGKPYIPGSSIKGAIRTALLSYIIENHTDDIENLDNLLSDKDFNDDKIIEEAFKKIKDEVEYNLMQCIQVGDCYFNNNILEILNTTLLNCKKDRNRSSVQTHANQIVECLCRNLTGNLSLKIIETDVPFRLKLNSLQQLFRIINSQTETVLDCEKDFWKDKSNDDVVKGYLDTCSNLLNEIKSIEKNKENSCILRLGFANGYNFITNKWTDFLSKDLMTRIAKAVRGNKDKGDKFPKTRRINITGNDRNPKVNLLGFVKLTIEE